MVLLAGPRQCGKTTLSKSLLEERDSYFNWDIAADRKTIQAYRFSAESKLWVFDELHKFGRWRNWLKGLYDEHGSSKQILVTGSAKLEAFSRGGDSLQGRYFRHRLHPFTVGELTESTLPSDRFMQRLARDIAPGAPSTREATESLLRFGGFPEPFTKQNERFSSRWHNAYAERLVREELRDLYRLQQLEQIELLSDRLPETVGGSLNYANFSKQLEVSFESIQRWVTALENLYSVFRVPPVGAPKLRAVKKEQKLYCWDWSRVEDPGARLENMVAVHLLRLMHFAEDVHGEKLELRYFRDVHGREVDFVILHKRVPWCAIEVKSSEGPVESSLRYFLERFPCPLAFQLSLKSKTELTPVKVGNTRIRLMPVSQFLAALP
jgi:uncharacterized protein